MALVDTFPYPWHLPDAQELHVVLCQVYPSSKGALFAADRAGVDPLQVNGDQAPYLVWKDIIEAAATAGKLRPLLTLVINQNAGNPKRSFLEALLSGQSPVTDREPRSGIGEPMFLSHDDQIGEPEALLFHDDLTLAIGRTSWLVDVLQRLQRLAPTVCRLEVTSNAASQHGTGFRIGPDLLLTNWHVLLLLGKPTAITADFGYEDDGKGGGLQPTTIPCDIASVVADPNDDWGIVRVAQPLPTTALILKLGEAVPPVLGEPAFLVQHPGGGRKRLAYVRNQITSVNERVVHYLSDTQTGSSGSPVFNEDGRLVGLHHAGGRPQEVAGKPPLKKNEGIRIERVVAGLQKAGIQAM